jgi:thiosulfate dehydrogenase [quinone] large subunit
MSTTYAERELQITAPEARTNGQVTREPERVRGGNVFGVLRITLGSVFLWAFFDKLLSLGFSTGRNADTGAIAFFGPDAWIHGGSPTTGFLKFGTKGPFADFFAGLAGNAFMDWAFMGALLLIGTALILGIGMRLATIGGVGLLGLMYAASAIWPDHHPLIDEHVVNSIALVALAYVGAGRYLGFGRRWETTSLVKRYPILK